MNENKRQSRRGGFSMVEVLVASTILIVIVMMLGMLFQQTSLSWRVGVKRASGFMQVRGVIGAIQRDATAAVDARYLPQDLVTEKQQFTPPLLFYTLSGTNRALTKVTYSIGGAAVMREERLLLADGNWGPPRPSNMLPSSGSLSSSSSTTLDEFKANYGQNGDLDSLGLPLYITFEATVKSAGANLDIGAASAGPDGKFGDDPTKAPGKDDIRTWVK